jgi:hypothetical protein
MWLNSWFRWLKCGSAWMRTPRIFSKKADRCRLRRPLFIEPLEGRTLLSALPLPSPILGSAVEGRSILSTPPLVSPSLGSVFADAQTQVFDRAVLESQQVFGYSGSPGQYAFRWPTLSDNVDNTFATTSSFTLDSSGFGSQQGTINHVGQQDIYRFVSPLDGLITIRAEAISGTPLITSLAVYGESPWDVAAAPYGTPNSQVQVNLTAGETYYVRVGGVTFQQGHDLSGGTGAYLLTFSPVPDDFGDTFATAQVLPLNASGSGNQSGTFVKPTDVDFFQFRAPTDGWMAFWQGDDYGVPGPQTAMLTVFDSAQRPFGALSKDQGAPYGVLIYPVIGGQTYYVQAKPMNRTFIHYTIHFAFDDIGKTMAQASPLTLDTNGSVTRAGRIDYAGQQDWYRLTAPATGRITFFTSVPATGRVTFFTSVGVVVFDQSGKAIADNDANYVTGAPRPVSFSVSAGQTYYFQVAAWDFFHGPTLWTGPYQILVYADDLIDAHDVTLIANGTVNLAGRIEGPDDVDKFRFTAPASGRVMVQNADFSNTLEAAIIIFDDSKNPLAKNEQGSFQFDVIAGNTYFVQIAGTNNTFGNYDLAFHLDASGIAVAYAVGLDQLGSSKGHVSVLYGPGLPKGLDIFSQEKAPDFGGEQNPQIPVPLFGAPPLPAPARLQAGGSGEDATALPPGSRGEERPWIRLMMGVDDPLYLGPAIPLEKNPLPDAVPNAIVDQFLGEQGAADSGTEITAVGPSNLLVRLSSPAEDERSVPLPSNAHEPSAQKLCETAGGWLSLRNHSPLGQLQEDAPEGSQALARAATFLFVLGWHRACWGARRTIGDVPRPRATACSKPHA